MKQLALFLSLMIVVTTFGQSTEKYNSAYEGYYRAEELYLKEQYAAARKEFRDFINTQKNSNDPFVIKASYYEAVSALELFNNDAIPLLLDFNKNYPESIYKHDIYFRLARYYYSKKKYDDALVWFNNLRANDLEAEQRDEFYFKMGYSFFKEDKYAEAKSAFYEIKSGDSQYANPALYYYSYIAYTEGSYAAALEGFLLLEKDDQFSGIAPYYIAQIYYLQGEYEKVTEYATKISSQEGVINESELDHLIGDAYYRIGKYDEAAPYLYRHYKNAETTRDEKYATGYALYKSGSYSEAISMLDKVKKEQDSLGQVAYYHIAECLLKLKNMVSARSAFKEAALMNIDPVVSEDALYNFAILSYQLDINPYDEAVEAFELYLNRYPNAERKQDVYQYLVKVYTSTNNHEKALASLDKIPTKDIQLKTTYQIVAFNLGVKHFEAGNFPEVIKAFDLVKRFPVDPQVSAKAAFWTADAHYRTKNYDQAIADYKKVLTMPAVPELLQWEARYSIGYAYYDKAYQFDAQEKFEQKRVMLQKAIEEFRLFLQSGHTYKRKKADAAMLIADAYYVLKENEQAVKYYEEVIAYGEEKTDQAYYYLALTYGYMDNKNSDRISSLLEIINNYPNSKFLQLSIYELAETYKSNSDFDKALKYYKQIVFDYPSSIKVLDAKMNIGDIYYKKGEYAKSEQYYMEVLNTYGSDQKVCERVADGLKDLYIAMNKPEKIETLAQQYPCANITPDEQENLYYLPAVDIYFDSTKAITVRYNEAIPKFEKYLEKFPSGRYVNDVKNYLADCHYQLGNEALAVELYQETLGGPTTGFTETAALRVSKYMYNNERYAEAIPAYKKTEEITAVPADKYNAQLGLMRCYFLLEQWPESVVYAEKVLNSSLITSEHKIEAHYAHAFGSYNQKKYEDAKGSLSWLTKNTNTERGTEAQYALADAEYQLGRYVEADQEVDKLLKRKPAYNYWIAKALILRSRILMQLGDLFGAEQNLKSVIEHYPNQDDGILDEANELWEELMQLKNQEEEFGERTSPTIEIEEDGN